MSMQDNWGTISFLIFYLGVIWTFLLVILIKNIKNHSLKKQGTVWKWTFLAYFFLAFGDIFHLGFRIYLFLANIPINSDITKLLLGTGYVITGITMTYFYVAFLHAWAKLYGDKYSTPKKIKTYYFTEYLAFVARIALLLLPFNHWFDYDPPLEFGFDFRIITSLPLYVIGLLSVILLFKHSKAEKAQSTGINPEWNKANYIVSLWFVISFICYTITLVGVVYIPLMGIFMIPKTIAYLVGLYYHYKYLLKQGIN